MSAIGYATIPVVPSLRGLSKALKSELQGPVESAAKKAGDAIKKNLSDGAQQAARDVATARKAEADAARAVAKAESEVESQKVKVEAQVKRVDVAEKQLSKTRDAQGAKVADAEAELARLRESGTATAEELAAAEKKVADARRDAEIAIGSKEAALISAREQLAQKTNSLVEKEKNLEDHQKRAADAADNLVAANQRMASSQEVAARGNGRYAETLATVREAAQSAGKGIAAFADKYQLQATAAMGAISLLGKQAIDYASEAEQSYGAVESIFGDHAQAIIDSSKSAADAVGLSGREYRELSSVTGAMLKNQGFAMDEVTAKTQDLVKIGADLAATFGGSTKDAIDAVNAALRGETDPIEKYGVSIKKADINARLAAKGLSGLEGEALKQAEAQEMLAMLTEQTASAQGQFAREVDTAAHKQQVATAKLNDAKETIGTALLPIYAQLADMVGKVAEQLGKHPGLVLAVVGAMAALAGGIIAVNAATKTWTALTVAANVARGIWLGLTGASTAAIAGNTVALAAHSAATKVAAVAQNLFNASLLANPLTWIVVAIAAVVAALWAFFTKTETGRQIWQSFMDKLREGWEWLKSVFGPVWDWIKDKASAAWEGISEAVGSAVDWVQEKLGTVKEIFSGLLDFFDTGDTTDLAAALGITEDSTIFTVLETIRTGFENFKTGVAVIWDFLTQKWSEFTSGFGQFYQTWIVPVITAFQTAWTAAQPVLTAVFSAIKGGFDLLGQGISLVWSTIIQPVWTAFQTSAQILGAVLAGAWSVIQTGFQVLGNIISSVWNNIIRPVFDFFRNAVGVLADVATGNFGNIRNRFSEMGNAVRNIVTGVINVALDIMKGSVRLAGAAWDAFKQTVANVVGIVRSKIGEMVSNIQEIPGKIKGFFSNAGSWLMQAGKDLIGGFIDGIKSMASAVGDAVSSVTSWIPGVGAVNGGITFSGGGIAAAYVDGGIAQLEQYANGGGNWLPSQATIKRPAGARGLVQWAEAETGGEAFIPLAASKRPRSEAILAKVADIFGAQLVDKVTGLPVGTGYRDSLGPTRVAAFEDGGIVRGKTAKQLEDFVWGRTQAMRRQLEGTPYVWGGGRAPTDWGDCSGTQSLIAGFVAGKWDAASAHRLFATGSQLGTLRSLGYTIGRPPAGFIGHATGWRNGGPAGGHTGGTLFLPGKQVNVEMGGGRGNGQIGGRAAGWNDNYFNQFAYRAVAAGGPAYKPTVFGDATTGMPGGPEAQPATSSSKPAGANFGTADALYKAAASYLGVVDDRTVQLMHKAAENTDPNAGSTDGSDWNGGGLDAAGVKAPADWGPAFFNFEIARQAKAKSLPIRGAMIGIGTTLVESGDPQKMFANRAVPASLGFKHDAVGSDHDSVGLFQQRQAGWGTLAQRMSPFESAGLFFDAMLRKFPKWEQMEPGAVAQGVQVSAFPDRYAGKMGKALELAKATRLYDTGGVLPHQGVSVNLSGKPEAILTNGQWQTWARSVEAMVQLPEPLRALVLTLARTADDVESISSKGMPALHKSLRLLADTAVTGTYRSNDLFAEDSPLVDAALAINDASKQIKASFDDTSKQIFVAGKDLGGEWLGQAQIVKDAEKGLLETRRGMVQAARDETAQLRQLEEARAAAHKGLSEAGGVGLDEEGVSKLERVGKALAEARAAGDIDDLIKVQDEWTEAQKAAIAEISETDSEEAKKRADALSKVIEAEEAYTSQQVNSLNAARKLEAAERAVVAARYTALGEIAKAVGDPMVEALGAVGKFADQIAKAAGIVEKLRQQVASLRMEQINLQVRATSAAMDLRTAELDVERTRMAGAISIAKAEADLAAAQRGQLQLNTTSVDALASAVDRFRVMGLDSIDDLTLTYLVSNAEVRAAEWALKMARAQANLDEQKALFDQLKAQHALQQATALQIHTAEMQRLVTAQLAAQTQAVAGMSQQAANGFGRWASGAQQGATGLFGLLGNVAGGLASFATGNIAGVISNVVGGIGNLGGLVMGANKMSANKAEAKEALAKLPAGQKIGLGLSLLGGAGAAGLGALASAQYGPDALGWGAQIGGALVGNSLGTISQMLADNMEAVNGRYEDQIAKIKGDYDLDKATAEAWMVGQEAKFKAQQEALQAAIDEAKLGQEQAKAEKDGAAQGVLDAYRAAMDAAARRREALNASVASGQVAVDAAVAKLGDKAPQPVTVEVRPGVYSDADVVAELDRILARLDGVEATVKVSGRASARDYVNAKVK